MPTTRPNDDENNVVHACNQLPSIGIALMVVDREHIQEIDGIQNRTAYVIGAGRRASQFAVGESGEGSRDK